jgi:hypothetical protein
MADSGKRKRPSSKASGPTEEGVLGSLPSTRPARMSRRRETTASTTEAKPAAAKAKPTTARAKPGAQASSPKPTATRKPPARKPSASPKPETATGPRAVRSGSPSLKQPPRRRRAAPSSSPPKGAELVTTAVQAAGELAQIGVTLGGQMVKRAVGKLPKP